jgi:hypothetical protein
MIGCEIAVGVMRRSGGRGAKGFHVGSTKRRPLCFNSLGRFPGGKTKETAPSALPLQSSRVVKGHPPDSGRVLDCPVHR